MATLDDVAIKSTLGNIITAYKNKEGLELELLRWHKVQLIDILTAILRGWNMAIEVESLVGVDTDGELKRCIEDIILDLREEVIREQKV